MFCIYFDFSSCYEWVFVFYWILVCINLFGFVDCCVLFFYFTWFCFACGEFYLIVLFDLITYFVNLCSLWIYFDWLFYFKRCLSFVMLWWSIAFCVVLIVFFVCVFVVCMGCYLDNFVVACLILLCWLFFLIVCYDLDLTRFVCLLVC